MITDPRLRFLGEAEIKEFVNEFDLFHIDFYNGEQVITVNKHSDYNRIMFTVDRNRYANLTEIYLTSLVVALRYVDGTVNNVCVCSSIYETQEEARKEIQEEFDYMKAIKDLELGYYDIEIHDVARGSINLDQFSNSDLTDYDIVAWRVELCRLVR